MNQTNRVREMKQEIADRASVCVSLIVTNYNARDRLQMCLRSIYADPPTESFEVLVIDDGSLDGSSDMVRHFFPEVKLLVNRENLGYTASKNLAACESKGRYLYFLNNDLELRPGAVDRLIQYLSGNHGAGGAGSMLCDEDGTVQASAKSLPSLVSALFGARSPLARWFPNNRFTRRELLSRGAGQENAFEAGYVSGASFMIPREVFERVGSFDTRFFYFEDADYCKRIRDLGLTVWCVPAAKVIHHVHEGGSMVNRRQRFWSVLVFHKGAYLYFRKHAGIPAWHPLYWTAALGLGGRLMLSLLLQLAREVVSKSGQ